MPSSSAYNKYPEGHKFNGARVLNLGCGFTKYSGKNIVNLDAFDNCKPDVVWDLAKTPLPFKDGEFDFILANHIFEHIPNWWACFEECCRILTPGGMMEIWVPGSGSDSVLGFRDHINTINHCSWFGTAGTVRAPGNAWAAANSAGPAASVSVCKQTHHMERYWWMMAMPGFARKWCATHLRNVIFESGYYFRKNI